MPSATALVRTGDVIPEIAVAARTNMIYMVWQDARATGGARDQIAFAKSTDAGRTWQTDSLAINSVAARVSQRRPRRSDARMVWSSGFSSAYRRIASATTAA